MFAGLGRRRLRKVGGFRVVDDAERGAERGHCLVLGAASTAVVACSLQSFAKAVGHATKLEMPRRWHDFEMICASCLTVVADDAQFCPRCGRPIPGAAPPAPPSTPDAAPPWQQQQPPPSPWQQAPSSAWQQPASWQPPPEPKRRTGLVVGIIAAAVAVVALVAVVAATRNDDDSDTEDFAIEETANDSDEYPEFMQDVFMEGMRRGRRRGLLPLRARSVDEQRARVRG